jgi:hypothetical protein
MSKTIKKIIKPDKDKQSVQVVIALKEDDITLAMAQADKISPSTYDLTYNQLCSLSQAVHAAIDEHYQMYSNCMEKEKTEKIYIDDPIDW